MLDTRIKTRHWILDAPRLSHPDAGYKKKDTRIKIQDTREKKKIGIAIGIETYKPLMLSLRRYSLLTGWITQLTK